MEDHQHPLIRIAEALERLADKLPTPVGIDPKNRCTSPTCGCVKVDF